MHRIIGGAALAIGLILIVYGVNAQAFDIISSTGQDLGPGLNYYWCGPPGSSLSSLFGTSSEINATGNIYNVPANGCVFVGEFQSYDAAISAVQGEGLYIAPPPTTTTTTESQPPTTTTSTYTYTTPTTTKSQAGTTTATTNSTTGSPTVTVTTGITTTTKVTVTSGTPTTITSTITTLGTCTGNCPGPINYPLGGGIALSVFGLALLVRPGKKGSSGR